MVQARPFSFIRAPKDGTDLIYEVDQLFSSFDAHRLLGGARRLGRLPEQAVQTRRRVDVVRLEEVGPQDPQMMLDELCPLVLDGNTSLSEYVIVGVVVFLTCFEHRLRLDSCLGRVVDAAHEVAVSVGNSPWSEQGHSFNRGVATYPQLAPLKRRYQDCGGSLAGNDSSPHSWTTEVPSSAFCSVRSESGVDSAERLFMTSWANAIAPTTASNINQVFLFNRLSFQRLHPPYPDLAALNHEIRQDVSGLVRSGTT